MSYHGNAPADVALVVGQDVITTTEIQDATIATADIASDAITATKVDDDGTGFQMGSLGLGTAVSGSHKLTVGGTATFSGDITGTLATASQPNITSVGTIGTGVWNGTAIASAYLDADTAHLSGTQTFSGAKTFSAETKFTDSININGSGTRQIKFDDGSESEGAIVFDEITDGFIFKVGGTSGSGKVDAFKIENSGNTTFSGQLKIDTDQRYFTKWESTYGTDRDYWWRNDGGLLQLGEGAEGDSQVKYTFDTANGRLGIGATAPSIGFIDARGTGASTTVDTATVLNLKQEASSTTANIRFNTATANSAGHIIFNTDGSFQIRTDGSNLTTFPNTGGVSFNSETGAANTLDDYEEGTYTGTITFAAGSISIHPDNNTLSYTKIGNTVHVRGMLSCNGYSSASGASLLNLPFTSSNFTDTAGISFATGVAYLNGSAITNANYRIMFELNESSDTARIFFAETAGGAENLGDNHIADGSLVYVNITYPAG